MRRCQWGLRVAILTAAVILGPAIGFAQAQNVGEGDVEGEGIPFVPYTVALLGCAALLGSALRPSQRSWD